MAFDIQLRIDPTAKPTLAEQIRLGLRLAIQEGRLQPGVRLPSWRDLAAQLGVARGTVRLAYERLADEQLIVASGAAGTHVAPYLPFAVQGHDEASGQLSLAEPLSSVRALMLFQMGVPAQDVFPFKVWSRIMARAARRAAVLPVSYPNPCGEPELRHEIAAYLSIARGMVCAPSQIIITNGYAGALGLAFRALGLEGAVAWMEEPGFPLTRQALMLSRIRPVPVPVDACGLDVEQGIATAPDAALVIVTAGQQAPLGVTLSLARRLALLDWAARSGSWVIEDDYLSELQLAGRAAPALAALDAAGRVIHIGTFSKTISPALRLGFLVAPPALEARFREMAAALTPASAAGTQLAVAEFMREGHYLRHLRKMKRVYAERRNAVRACLQDFVSVDAMAGLAMMLRLPDGARDINIADQAHRAGLAPMALSPWYAAPESQAAGLLLGVSNAREEGLPDHCARLRDLIRQFA